MIFPVFVYSEGKPLWSFEDITAKCLDIKSATELTEFLVAVLKILTANFQKMMFGEVGLVLHPNGPFLVHHDIMQEDHFKYYVL